jgi:hypothetical protein
MRKSRRSGEFDAAGLTIFISPSNASLALFTLTILLTLRLKPLPSRS